jgi:Fe-S cluster assembly protein SufD
MAAPATILQAKRDAAEAALAATPAPAGEAGWARDARQAAEARLREAGAPARRDEYWKYTDPTALLEPPSVDSAADAFAGVETVALRVGADAPQIQGAAIATLGDALAADLGWQRELFGALEAAGQEKVARPLAALNTARATQGFAIRVTAKPSQPLRIENAAPMARHLVRVDAGAEATILEVGTAGNTCMEIDLAPGASLHHVRVQEGAGRPAAATHVFARVAEGAALRTFTLSADGALTRNEVVADLTGDDAVAHIGGGVLAAGESLVDNTVFVTHSALRGESRQVFKNVADGSGRIVFQGKIFVRKPAQKTDGYQISQSILLSDKAEFLAKPELEIYADDVACSHGSTTGAIDADQLFYLQARGVPRAAAESLLVAAFVDEAIEEIADEALADAVRARVAAWMDARGV